jgi:hypothetical protein
LHEESFAESPEGNYELLIYDEPRSGSLKSHNCAFL